MDVLKRHISKLLSYTLRAGEGGAPPMPAAVVGKDKPKGSGSSSSARNDSDKDLRQQGE